MPEPLRSVIDPAFAPDLKELAALSRQLLDRLELLIDTAPADLEPQGLDALRGAVQVAARTHDTLRWLVEPTAPAPETSQTAVPADDAVRLCARTWVWRAASSQLEEMLGETLPVGLSAIYASWVQESDAIRLELYMRQCAYGNTEVIIGEDADLPWEVGAVRVAAATPMLSPIIRAVLRQVLIEGLERSPRLPPIAIAPQQRPLTEVAHG